MEETKDIITWFEIVKDIIIPVISIISTLIIGIVIAVILKKRDENKKIKQLLIDYYMEYLTVKTNSFEMEIENLYKNILHLILVDKDQYFEQNANRHFSYEKIKNRIKSIDNKLNTFESKDTNWSIYTYRFAFLIGKKVYFKEALPLENNITNKFISEELRDQLKDSIFKKIESDDELMKNLNESNTGKIDFALDDIYKLVIKLYNEFHFQIFNPYNNKIAELINNY